MALDIARVTELLASRDGWVEAGYLADTLGVTTRTIRNYVRTINEKHGSELIESSYKGYRLTPEKRTQGAAQRSSELHPQEERADIILRRLISATEPLSVYDLADELFVSDSTIEADLRRVRDSIHLFDLVLSRYRDTVHLEGSELSKRKLIGQLLVKENPVGFSAFTGSGIMHEGYDRVAIASTVSSSLDAHQLHADDFGLNNVLVHLVIMVDRIRQGKQMPDDASSNKAEGTAAHLVAQDICEDMAKSYQIVIPPSEVGYLSLVIASNTRGDDYSFASKTDLTTLVDERDIEITQQAVAELEHAYYLEPFDSDFIMRMAVHVHSLFQRVENSIGSRNPLLESIKESYPLVYDMAVFLAGAIARRIDMPISEDEIAFLAFHIGAYLEKSSPENERVTATFLYVDYHGMYRLALDRIREEFKSTLSIVGVEPVAEYAPEKIQSDLVLSPMEVDTSGMAELVVLSPLLNDADLRSIRKAIDKQTSRKRGAQTFLLINRFLTPELFKCNVTKEPEEMIRFLSQDCLEKGYVNEGFCEEVLEREAMSPTSFANGVAIPHSLSASANRSFLSIVANEQPMQWGSNSVNLVLLMGISANDRKAFRLLFDSLLEVLSEPANVKRLARCSDFTQFADQLNGLIS